MLGAFLSKVCEMGTSEYSHRIRVRSVLERMLLRVGGLLSKVCEIGTSEYSHRMGGFD